MNPDPSQDLPRTMSIGDLEALKGTIATCLSGSCPVEERMLGLSGIMDGVTHNDRPGPLTSDKFYGNAPFEGVALVFSSARWFAEKVGSFEMSTDEAGERCQQPAPGRFGNLAVIIDTHQIGLAEFEKDPEGCERRAKSEYPIAFEKIAKWAKEEISQRPKRGRIVQAARDADAFGKAAYVGPDPSVNPGAAEVKVIQASLEPVLSTSDVMDALTRIEAKTDRAMALQHATVRGVQFVAEGQAQDRVDALYDKDCEAVAAGAGGLARTIPVVGELVAALVEPRLKGSAKLPEERKKAQERLTEVQGWLPDRNAPALPPLPTPKTKGLEQGPSQ